MEQLQLFEDQPSSKKRREITPELVLEVTEAIKKNKKLNNIQLIESLGIARRTFYKIKSGYYQHLLEQALEKSVDSFDLELTD